MSELIQAEQTEGLTIEGTAERVVPRLGQTTFEALAVELDLEDEKAQSSPLTRLPNGATVPDPPYFY